MVEFSESPVNMTRGRGWIAIYPAFPYGAVAVFGEDGKFRRLLGRRGRAPGEFLQVDAVVPGLADSLFVFDGLNRRLTTYNARLQLGSTTPMEGHVSSAAAAGGRLYGAVPTATDRGGKGYVFELSRTGNIGRPLLPDEPFEDHPFDRTRLLSAAGDSTLIVARVFEYAVALVSLTGGLSTWIRPEVDWFPPGSAELRRPPWEVRPEPLMLGAQLLDGALVTLVQRARPGWKAAVIGGTLATPKGANLRREMFFETVLECRSPSDGRLLASRVLGADAIGLGAGGELLRYVVEPDGSTSLQLSRLRLRGYDQPTRR